MTWQDTEFLLALGFVIWGVDILLIFLYCVIGGIYDFIRYIRYR